MFGGYDGRFNQVMPVEKYSPATNTWDVIAQMYEDRVFYCACSFVDSIYVIGGYLNGFTNSCLEFNTKNNSWRETASTNVARINSSCAVFEERIVVSGGHLHNEGRLNIVEAYDHIDDSWKYMPNMLERRNCHKSIAIKNKLFVIGSSNTTTVEVFDSCCGKFVFFATNS